ncbi:MAG: nucleotidyl transferase AbiEii/AbiGii toxin family protein [Firmicutes bacterium]|nr:nucleotidyl transferase AbiEii/AbiGii toxin family protein [Bacillota bacterium]
MPLTEAQVKGRIKSLAKKNNADARVLMRIYMMERFLERMAASPYADNFIIKGGILVTSMVGIAMRSTMDVDTSLQHLELSEENSRRIAEEIVAVNLNDDVHFHIKDVSRIMDDMEYPGIRIAMDATLGMISTPVKIDISTGDVITPGAIEYSYPLMLDDRSIRLWSYNPETILAEKLQTVLARGVLNTRMRDFYDIHMLLAGYSEQINTEVLQKAFHATCKNRRSLQLEAQGGEILALIATNDVLHRMWKNYQRKFPYAAEIPYTDVTASVAKLFERTQQKNTGLHS